MHPLAVLLLLLLAAATVRSDGGGDAMPRRRACPCADARLCEPVAVRGRAAADRDGDEVVYGFAVEGSAPDAGVLELLTDVCVFNEDTDEAMCAVRSARVHAAPLPLREDRDCRPWRRTALTRSRSRRRTRTASAST